MDSAYQKFFKEHTGFPKFKSKHDHNYSYTTNLTNNNIKVLFHDNLVKLPKLGKVKAKLHREFKANWYGRTYHKISPWFASSQICSECGAVNKKVKLLSIRKWTCEECNYIHDRDENASKNILKQGIKELGLGVAI